MIKMLSKLRQSLSLQHSNAELTKTHDILHIREGDLLTFLALKQEDISQKQLIVGAQTTHHFSGNQFVSNELLDYKGVKICSMIVASKENEPPYLALSRMIPEPHKPYLCTDEDFQMLNAGEMPDQLYVRENTAQMLDWLSLRYDLRLKNMRGTSISTSHEVKNFTYSLYAANGKAKALEIEHYPSGECAIYATIFMPASEIASITHCHANFKPAAASKPQPANNNTQPLEHEPDKILSISPKAAKKVATASPINAIETGDLTAVRCNLRMAAKLIDEAMRNDMRVVDVMRRALGLSVSENDLMAFDLKLTPADYKILADRFELFINDRAAINSLIMEELSHFTGVQD